MEENFNISPEMINNIVNMFKQANPEAEDEQDSDENIDFEENNSSNNNNGFDLGSIDFETIMKIKSVMDNLNKKDDPRTNLLYSLKPYLRKSKQSKLDQYANLLKIAQVSDLFKNEKPNEFKKGEQN